MTSDDDEKIRESKRPKVAEEEEHHECDGEGSTAVAAATAAAASSSTSASSSAAAPAADPSASSSAAVDVAQAPSASPASASASASAQAPPPTTMSKKEKKKNKRRGNRGIDPSTLQLRKSIQFCCKTDDLPAALQLYDEAKTNDVTIEPQTFYNLLHLCSSSSSSGEEGGAAGDDDVIDPIRRAVHVGTPRTAGSGSSGRKEGNDNDAERGGKQKAKKVEEEEAMNSDVAKEEVVPEEGNNDGGKETKKVAPSTIGHAERRRHAFRIKSHMDSLHLPLTEPACTALIRILSRKVDEGGGVNDGANDNGVNGGAAYSPKDHDDDDGNKAPNGDAKDKEGEDDDDAIQMCESLLAQAESTQQCKPKLRTYAPLFHRYAVDGRTDGVVRTWKRIVRQDDGSGQPLRLTEREYGWAVACATKTGDVKLMERTLEDLAEDVLVPCRVTTEAIVRWFGSVHAIAHAASAEDEAAIAASESSSAPSSALDRNPLPPNADYDATGTIGPIVAPSRQSWIVTRGCTINSKTGEFTSGCLAGKRLQPVGLSESSWIEMTKRNQTLVLQGKLDGDTSEFLGGGKGRKRPRDGGKGEGKGRGGGKGGGGRHQEGAQRKRERQWESFLRFLDRNGFGQRREEKGAFPGGPDGDDDDAAADAPQGTSQQPPRDIVIDGANVGYYQQNFANAPRHVDYRQIDWIVRHFLDRGHKVLLVLHVRHFAPNLLPQWAVPIVKSWEEGGCAHPPTPTSPARGSDGNCNENGKKRRMFLYKAPAGCNDDWFWMHAALCRRERAYVVTNDEMRDHHFQMLAHRPFLRWKERHRVRFAFGGWDHDDVGGSDSGVQRDHRRRRDVLLEYPDPYSRRIQRLEEDGIIVPLPKKGDEDRFLDGAHVADESEPDEETYVCIKMA